MNSLDLTQAITRQDCEAFDRNDPLAPFRNDFVLPEDIVYLDGNSLGALPKNVARRIATCTEQEWGEGLIRSWNQAGWFTKPRELGARIGRLIGAGHNEVVVTDTTSVNLFKVLSAALTLRPERRVIVSEEWNFPTDLYIAQGIASWQNGYKIRTLPGGDRNIEALLDDDVAVVSLSHVNYRSGAIWDMEKITRMAHECGALVVWDLAHSAGALPVDLNACKADFAVGCTYKYLNGGPGSPAFLFVAERYHGEARQPLTGWWGHVQPFAFDSHYQPDKGIGHFLVGTQPVLALAALEASLDLWDRVDMFVLRSKSEQLTDLFIRLVEQECSGYELSLASPRQAESRGSQVSWRHKHGYAVMQALISRGVIGDFRAPDIIRFGFTPLYLRFVDVWYAVAELKHVLVHELWREQQFNQQERVT